MDDFSRLVTFLDGLADAIDNEVHLNGYEEDFGCGVFAYIRNNDDNFYSCGCNITGYEEFSKYDIKYLLIRYMYAIYAFYYLSHGKEDVLDDSSVDSEEESLNDFDNFFDEDNCSISYLLKNYDYSDEVFDSYFENNGVTLCDLLLFFYSAQNRTKKYDALCIKKDEDFDLISSNNLFFNYLYNLCSNIYVNEENFFIEKFFRTCENLMINSSSDMEMNLKKMKSHLILSDLVRDLKNNVFTPSFRHTFSIMINNIYADIAYSMSEDEDVNVVDFLNSDDIDFQMDDCSFLETDEIEYVEFMDPTETERRVLSKEDRKFFNSMTNRSVTFDSLLNRFIKDYDFAYYILNTFYVCNYLTDEDALSNKNDLIESDKKYSKVKKFFSK